MKITIVVPTYNERANITRLLPAIFKVFKQNKLNGNVIVVDDNSPDGTAQEVKKLYKKFKIFLIERKGKLGLGSAYIEGFKKAIEINSDLIFEMDADFSHNPKYIPKFIHKIKQGYGVVVGSRLEEGGKVIGWNWIRKLISKIGNAIGRYIANVNVSDLTSGYRVYKKEVLQKINLNEVKSQSYDFQLEMLARVLKIGFEVGTVPIIFVDRKFGKSKLSKTDILNFISTALKIRFGLI
jgi:dolichol-phosphate mannosyltransferase